MLYRTNALKYIASSLALFILFSNCCAFAKEKREDDNKNKKEIQLPLKELQNFSEVFQHIKLNYHKDITDKELINSAISGMLNQLGDYTRYYSPQEYSQFSSSTDGQFSGKILPSVSSEFLGSNTAYLSIAQFTKKTPIEIISHLNRLIQKYNTEKLIVDLRNNLGGVLESSVSAVDLFLQKGIIYSSNGKSEESSRIVNATTTAPYKNITVIVMINENTASSSEIFSAALQENHRALILGKKSFGKGTIQTVFSLRSGAGIKITTSEYLTPNGNKIQKNGVSPDIKYKTDNLSNELGKPIFDDLQIYQAYLQIQSNIDRLEIN